ncbi:hypothetical protein MMC21_000040 [Puttea exsequens]|nr:hypothetical protein [Puttea exsequens]
MAVAARASEKPAGTGKETGVGAEVTKDFDGDVKVNNKLPTTKELERVKKLPVLDTDKKSYTFGSLIDSNHDEPQRVLVVFIRHFFCGNCQEYIRTLSASLPPSSLPLNTSLIIIGCGSPALIPMYTAETACPYPIYADPTRALYSALHMTKTLALGPAHPEYMQRSLWSVVLQSIVQEFRSGRYMLSGGDYRQVGGEFVFEGGRVSWCHRMRNTRDHAALGELRRQLGLDGGVGVVRRERWSTSGLGQGLGRRLSERRRSWGVGRSRSRSRSRVGEGRKASPPISAMEGVREHEEGMGTREDALMRLEGKGMNGTVANGIANDDFIETANGHVKDTPNDDPNGHANNALASDNIPTTTPNGAANGHPIDSSNVKAAMNETANRSPTGDGDAVVA